MTNGEESPPPGGFLLRFLRAPLARGAACALLLGAGVAEAQTGPRGPYGGSVNNILLEVYFTAHLNTGSLPHPSAFQVRATSPGGSTRTISGFGSNVDVSGVTLTVALDVNSPVREGETVTVRYTKPATNPLQWVDGGEVPAFSWHSVTNETDATKPTLAFAELNGTTLTLYYDDVLKTSAVPGRTDFLFRRGSGGAAAPTGNPSVSGNTVTIPVFTASTPAKHGETVRFAYTPNSSAANRIQDRSGNQADAIAQWAEVDNQTQPALSSAPVVTKATLVLTFDGDLDEDPEQLPPGSAFTVLRVRSGTTTTVGLIATNPVAVSGRTVTLWLAEAVLRTDTVTVAYTAPATGGKLRDDDNRELPVPSFPNRQAANSTPAPAGPEFSRAAVNGNTLAVTFDLPLQTTSSSTPPRSAFAVSAKPPYGTARTISGSGGNVTISGNTVTVLLADEVERGESVTVRYAVPTTNKLRGTNTLFVNPFSGQPATNNSPGSPAPTFSGASYSYPRGGITVEFTGPFLGCADSYAWRIQVDGGTEYPQSVRCEDRAVLLVLAALTTRPAVEVARRVTVSYHRGRAEAAERSKPLYHPPRGSPGPSARLRGTDGSVVASFDDQTVTGLKPRLVAAPPTVDGRTLTLTFDEELDPGATPGPWLFHVTVNDERRSVVRDGVAIAGKTVRLTLRSPVAAGDTVTVRYTQPARCWGHCSFGLRGASHIAVDSFPDQAVTNNSAGPVFASATVDGKTLTVTFDKNLDTGSKPAPGAFRVTVNNARRSVASGGVAIAGKTVTLTLFRSVSDDDTVKVRYTKPSANPLRGANGLAVDTFAEQAVIHGTPGTFWSGTITVRSIGAGHFGCTSSACGSPFTHAGTTYSIFQITRLANGKLFFSISAPLSQSWTLHIGDDEFAVADATLANSNRQATWSNVGFTWTDNQQVSLRLAEGSDTSGGSGGGSGLIGGEAPWVTGVSVASGAGADKTYGLGDTIRVWVDFVEAVEVTGTPRLKIDMDPAAWGEKWASYESGSGTRTLIFAHTVVEPNYSTQGIAVLANTLALNGGTIRAGGADANLAHDGLDHDANHKVNWQTASDGGVSGTDVDDPLSGTQAPVAVEDDADSGPPTVTGVSVVSSPASGDTYLLGETIRIRASFSDAVAVTGSPRLSIDMDSAHWGTKQAAYASGSGTSSLDFVHTVVEPNFSTQGIAVLANSLALNGGTIRSAAANANAALAHSGLGHDSGHKVDWRPTISVADARANEGAGAKVAFEVSLSRAFTSAGHRVTVDYATSDGTAKAGADYTATSGTLTFAAGETVKTVNVPILDDSHDEGEETFTLRLSNAAGARIGDGEATGAIVNADPMPRAWLARFGRTLAEQVVAGVQTRMEAPRGGGAHARIAGHDVAAADGLAAGHAPVRWPAATPEQPRTMSGGELLAGSAFAVTSTAAEGGLSAALWGRGGWSRFDGREEEGLSVDGEVTTALIGAEVASGAWLGGVMLSHARGDGNYRSDADAGTVASALTAVHPYVGVDLSERLTAWAAGGLGLGGLTLTPEGAAALETDLTLVLAASGARGRLVEPAAGSGFSLAIETDAYWVRTSSAAAAGLAETQADATRIRLGLDGGYRLALAGGGTLEPTVEIGVRHDGGHAETGYGMDLGGGLAWSDPALGLSAQVAARGLLTGAFDGFREVGVSGSLAWDPDPASDRGPSLTATQTVGAAASGGSLALFGRPTLAGLTATADGLDSHRLDLRAGYGFATAGDRFTMTPEFGLGLSETGRDYTLGWRLTQRAPTSFAVGIEGTRRESAHDRAKHDLGLTMTASW